MAKCLVVYASKYGSTLEVAQAIADGLGADLAAATSHPDVRNYDLVVVGSPIYGGNYLEEALHFIRAHKPYLAKRKMAAFVTAAAHDTPTANLSGQLDNQIYTQQDYADGLARFTGGEVLDSRGFGGRRIPDQLDQRDFNALNWFHQFLMNRPLEGFDLLDLPAAFRWGECLREMMGE